MRVWLAATLFTALAAAAPGAPLWEAAPAGKRSARAAVIAIDATEFAAARRSGGAAFDVELPGGGRVVLEAEAPARRLAAPNAQLILVGAGGTRTRPLPEAETLVGQVAGDPGSFFHLARVGGQWFGTVRTRGAAWCIVPVEEGGRATGETMITAEAMDRPAPHCGVQGRGAPAETGTPSGLVPATAAAADRVRAADRQIDVWFEATTEFFQARGSDEDSAGNYIVAMAAEISAIYERDVQTAIQVVGLRIFTDNSEPYAGADSEDYLNDLTAVVRSPAAPPGLRGADTVHLVHTTLPVWSVGLGGLAWLDVLCDNQYKAGFSDIFAQFTFPMTSYASDVEIVAHELGHNCGSDHTHCYSPPIDMCYNREAGCYNGTEVASPRTIMSYCATAFQLSELYFHPRVITVLRNRIVSAACVTSIETPTPTPTPTPSPTVTPTPTATPNPSVVALLEHLTGIEISPDDANGDKRVDAADLVVRTWGF